jgi:DNA polymerase IV
MELPFPPIFLLPRRLSEEEQSSLEERIPSLTYDIREATIVLGKVTSLQRARLELQSLNLLTTPVALESQEDPDESEEGPRAKRVRLSENPDLWDGLRPLKAGDVVGRGEGPELRCANTNLHATGRLVEVVKIEWFTESVEEGRILPVDRYILYRGLVLEPQKTLGWRPQATGGAADGTKTGTSKDITVVRRSSPQPVVPHRPALLQQTTSEHDAITGSPELPAYLKSSYSCQRPTPAHPPNESFIDLLKRIRTIRILRKDPVGERAYSTAIASIAAYPHPIRTAHGRPSAYPSVVSVRRGNS